MNALPTCTLWALILLLTCVSLQSSPPQLAKSDQTGKFILPSSTGNNYVIIIYDYDSNFNFAQPFCNCTAACLLAAFKHLHIRLCQAGLRQKLQRLDNGCSTLLKELLLDVESIDFQLVPPAVHRRNAAKRAIKTFHNYFIAGLCSVDKDFPLHLWDQLISQAELTLNLLRASRINPKLSAWARQVHGIFDYNRCPLAPPGCCVLVHEKPQNRTTWSPHALDRWYVGPALDSYRCYCKWMWDTCTTRIYDTMSSWFPTKVVLSTNSSTDLIATSLQDIAHVSNHPTSPSPVTPLTTTQKAALQQIIEILSTILPPISPTIQPHPVPPPHATSLRVAITPGTTTDQHKVVPNDDNPMHSLDSTCTDPLRMMPLQIGTVIPMDLPEQATPPCVSYRDAVAHSRGHSPPAHPIAATYATVTGHQGCRNRQKQRRATQLGISCTTCYSTKQSHTTPPYTRSCSSGTTC